MSNIFLVVMFKNTKSWQTKAFVTRGAACLFEAFQYLTNVFIAVNPANTFHCKHLQKQFQRIPFPLSNSC